MSKPIFTILSAVYKSRKYLRDWANSILAQTYRPLEVVVTIDHGNDRQTAHDLAGYCESFKKKDIDATLILAKNRLFCASSYLKAFHKSKGKFFGVLDSDDRLKKDAVEFIMNLYNKHQDIGWIYTQFNIYSSKGKYIKRGFCCPPNPGKSLLDFDMKQHSYSHWRTFSKRIPNVHGIFCPGQKCAVDKYMGYRLEELYPGMFIDRVCYKYRQRFSDSVVNNEPTKKTWQRIIKEARDRRRNLDINPYEILIG